MPLWRAGFDLGVRLRGGQRALVEPVEREGSSMPAGMDQMFGTGVKGKLGKMAMNRMVKKNKKKKKKRK